MKKIIDLLAGAGSHKDEKLLDYVRRNYLISKKVTNICFVTGVENNSGIHTQITANELRELAFKKNDKDTIYFLRSFFFSDVIGKAILKLLKKCVKTTYKFLRQILKLNIYRAMSYGEKNM